LAFKQKILIAMTEKQALAIDQLDKDGTLPIMPNPPLFTSQKSGWRNIHLAHFRQPAWELPEFYTLQHTIVWANLRQTVNVEHFSDGRWQKTQYHPNDFMGAYIDIFPANQHHKICWDNETEFTHLHLEPTFVSHIAHESIDPERVEIIFKPKISDSLIYQICLALKADLDVDGKGNGFYADSMATTLAAHLLRHYSTYKYQLREYEDGFSKHKLQQAVDYINAKSCENVSLTEISTELDMSPYYFCRLFKKSTGITPHQYLIQQRVERAKQLLRQPENKIADVAMDCGFANPSHFAKHFRKYTGVSPKQFRQV
jgi:AraC family transcriptional regulator